MNEVTTSNPLSADTLAHVLGTGDLSKLTTQQRVEYLVSTCRSLGLNPLTRPFRFLALNGQIQLYATKDCTDQLRSVRGITLHLVDKQIESDLYIVTARARSKDGREDEDIGAVMLPRSGESRANALMKGTTKAKRRVTLSICGLGGILDESELDTVPGAVVFDAEDEAPVAPIRDERSAINDAVPLKPVPNPAPRQRHPQMPSGPVDPNPVDASTHVQGDIYDQHNIAIELLNVGDSRTWMSNLEMLLAEATSLTAVEVIGECESVKRTIEKAPGSVRARVSELLAKACKRFIENDPDHSAEDLPDVEIEGERNVMAGD